VTRPQSKLSTSHRRGRFKFLVLIETNHCQNISGGRTMRCFLMILAAGILAGCTHSSEALTVTAPASEIRVDRRVDQPVAIVIDPDIDTLSSEAAENSYTCSAHSYPITIGPAVRTSLINVLDEAFSEVNIVSSSQDVVGDGFVIVFRPDTFRPTISFATGFWQGTANASSEIVLKVTVRYDDDVLFNSMTIAGRGASNGQHKGGCDVGAVALKDAAEESIRRLMENFVYKVVNTGDLRDAASAAEPLS